MNWLKTKEAEANAVAGWAHARGLGYERAGSLPPVSTLLQEVAGANPRFANGRPKRWSENVCTGELPGGVSGALGHHVFFSGHSDDWDEALLTITTATVLDGTRIARGFTGETHPVRVVTVTKREYGDEDRAVGAPDGRFTWSLPVETDDAPFQQLFDARVVAALQRLPADRLIVGQREGSLSVALLNRLVTDPAELDALSEATAALAAAMRRVAHSQRQLAPGDVLPEPRATPYRDWVSAGAAQIPWSGPPANLDEAVAAYRTVAATDPAVKRRRRRGRAVLVGIFAFVGAIMGAITGVVGGAIIGGTMFLAVSLIGVGIALLVGKSIAGNETGFRSQAWGLEAFSAEFARSRGLYLEDAQEVCRRFTMPLFGSPQRAMRGELAPGVPGRIVFWRDRNDPSPNAFVNVAVVPGTLAPGTSAAPPFGAVQTGHWIVVYEKGTRAIRSAARLDAIAAEAVRLASVATAAV